MHPAAVNAWQATRRRVANTEVAKRSRNLLHQYVQEGPVPLRLVLVAFIASIGSAALGLKRNHTGFIDSFLVEVSVIGAGVVIANIVVAGMQRGQRAQSAWPVLERLSASLIEIAIAVTRSVGRPSGTLVAGVAAADLADRLRDARSALSTSAATVDNTEPGVRVSEEEIAAVGGHMTAVGAALLELPDLGSDPKLMDRHKTLKQQVQAWMDKAWGDHAIGSRHLRSAAGRKNAELVLQALEELAVEAVKPFRPPHP
jgi:hypothetical protein